MKKELNFSVETLKDPEKSIPRILNVAKSVHKYLLIDNIMKSNDVITVDTLVYFSLDD